jgi:arylsulfate sulfotransferase
VKFNRVRWFIILALIQAAFSFNCSDNQTFTIVPSNAPNAISVSISPSASVVITGQTLQLAASVTGTDKKVVAWTIFSSSVDAGTIDASGLYNPPATALLAPVRIQAASVANPTKTAVATVWVLAPGTVSTTNHPLVARYSMTVPDGSKVKVRFGPDTSYGFGTWTLPAASGGGPEDMLVAGMRASSTYHMQAVVDLPDGIEFRDVDHTFQTGTVPSSRLPQISVSTSSTLRPNPGVELLQLTGSPQATSTTHPLQAVITDLQGNVIWYYDLDPTGTLGYSAVPFKLMQNGHIVAYVYTAGTVTGGPGILREIDLTGNTVRELGVADLNSRLAAAGINLTVNALHHDFAMLPNGHVILLVFHEKDFTDLPGYPGTTTVRGDALVDLDQNWNPVWAWDTFDHLDVNRHPRGLPDWTHGNAVIYSADDGNLLYSSRHQSWVIKIDYEDGNGNGAVLWKFGYQGDFTLDSGAPAAWQYGQHDIHILSPSTAGTFTLGAFDNGYIRVLDDSGSLCGTTGQPACYSRVPFFQVDEATRMAHVLWEASPLPYSAAVGSIELLDNGDVEFDEGSLPANPYNARVAEVTQETNPQTVWQLDVTGQVGYRIYRIPSLYPGVQW